MRSGGGLLFYTYLLLWLLLLLQSGSSRVRRARTPILGRDRVPDGLSLVEPSLKARTLAQLLKLETGTGASELKDVLGTVLCVLSLGFDPPIQGSACNGWCMGGHSSSFGLGIC